MLMEMQKRFSPYRDFLESKYIILLIIKFKNFIFGGFKPLLYNNDTILIENITK